MKKRKGFIRYEWPDGSVDYRPIDPDTRAIPSAGWVGDDGAIAEWVPRKEDDTATVEWFEVQDTLDNMAQSKGRGAKSEKDRRRLEFLAEKFRDRGWQDKTANWIYERLQVGAKNYDDTYNQWWLGVSKGSEFEGEKPPGRERILKAAALLRDKNNKK